MHEDVELLERWRNGEAACGDVLLRRHFASVRRFFCTKIGDDVDDLVQQTFLGCVEKRDQVKNGAFRPYLFGIARKKLYERLRQQKKHVDMDADSIAHLGTTPSQKVARNEEQRLLLLAMQELSVNAHIVLELTYWEGLSGSEVAEVLGISEHTVRSRLFRARDALRDKLAQLTPTPADAERTWEQLDANCQPTTAQTKGA